MTLPPTIGVTGAAGFIGANLVERLLDEGATVDRRRRHVDGHAAQPGGPSRPPEFPVRAVRLPGRRAHARGHGPLRRDRPHGRAEDPPLRRRAQDAARQRRRLARRARARPRDRRARRARLHVGRLRPGDAAVRRGRPDRARPARHPPLVLRRVEVLRRAPRAADGRGGGPEGHHPALLQRLRRPQPPVVVGRPAVGVLRGPARRPRDGPARRRPADPLVHLRQRHRRRRRARAAASGDLGRGDQHRRRPADRDRRSRRRRSRRPSASRARCAPASCRSSRSAATTRTCATACPT